MAQVVRHGEVGLESLWSQDGEVGLESFASQAMEKSLMLQTFASYGGGQEARGAYQPAGQLTYAEPKGWIINPSCAVLNGCRVLHVHGEYMTRELQKLLYEVSFEVLLQPKCNIKEVELTLTLPDGSKESKRECLSNYPRNKPTSLKVGDFFNRFEGGNIKFELKGTECKTCKTGLVVFGVLINPDGIRLGTFNASDA